MAQVFEDDCTFCSPFTGKTYNIVDVTVSREEAVGRMTETEDWRTQRDLQTISISLCEICLRRLQAGQTLVMDLPEAQTSMRWHEGQFTFADRRHVGGWQGADWDIDIAFEGDPAALAELLA